MMPPIGSPLMRVAGGGKPRILLVDDDNGLRESLNEFLQRRGYDVTEAYDGEDAMLKYTPGAFSAVICDNKMPKMDGPALIARIRKMSPKQPIILHTGEKLTEDDKRRIGADAYVPKPTVAEDLMAALQLAVKTRV